MSLLARTLYAIRAPQTKYPAWALAQASDMQYGMPDASLPTSQGELYQRLSWVYVAVSTIAAAVASQPLAVKQVVGEDTQDVNEHPFEQLLRRPNPLMSRFELLFATVAYRELTGNAYWWLNKASQTGPPDELWLIPSNKVKPIPDGKLYIKGYEYESGHGETMLLPVDSVCHFKRFHPANPFVGLSPIEPLATVAIGDLAMQKWNTNYFSKNNAKLPGALAFSDPIPDMEWNRLKEEFRRDYSGTERQLLMLRGSGAGGVQWVEMSATQSDMEFLSGRQFTKEEIFQVFGLPPGLIDKNATEANSTAAKAVFSEYTVYPLLTALGETITNGILPAYGERLVAEFDDPRKTDRVLELTEQQEYARYHTLNEVRQQKYGNDPLPPDDPRGEMLAAEIAPGVPHSKAETDANREAMREQMQGQEERQDEEVEPGPTPEPPTETAQQQEPGEPETKAELDLTELRRWRDKTRRRGKVTDWEPEAIAPGLVAAIKAAQGHVSAPAEAFRFIKAVEDSRLDAEELLTELLGDTLGDWLKRFIRAINGGEPLPWDEFAAAMDKALLPQIVDVMTEEVLRQSVAVGVGFDVGMVNLAALEWSRTYTYDLVRGLTDTTRKVVQEAVGAFEATPGMTRGDLEKLLAPSFGERRASAIAVTEVTRASSQAALQAQTELAGLGMTMKRRWYTLADERVCPICGPLHGKTEDVWMAQFPAGPPAHPNCRCAVVLQAGA